MATDFFQRQDHARQQTTRLLVMFAFSVAAIILAVYLVVVLGTAGVEQDRYGVHVQPPVHPNLWNPVLFAWVALGTLLVVGLGSLYKIAELSAGGEQVALMLGGRAVNPQTTDLAERRLLNVVEEMALASGIAVPPVYVLDHEPGINAFAAGHQPGDAVVAVSAGCLQCLTREELQGVMGHEFSHVLNGDMRLNLRLIGIVYGILVLAILGYYVMRLAGASSGNSKREGGAAGFFFLGLALLIFGYLGVFFGKLIKSAISRQREFLADASSVQFTRNPGGIVGALKKIGGATDSSRIRDAHAEEISHMFFGDAFAGALFNLFATHPPLEARIRAFEPEFDGQFPQVEPVAATEEDLQPRSPRPQSGDVLGPTMGRVLGPTMGGVLGPTMGGAVPAVMALNAGYLLGQIGQPQAEHLQHAGQMVDGMPQPLLDAAREPFVAQAVIYALVLSQDDEATRAQQLKMLEAAIEPPLFRQMQLLLPAAQSLSAAARLPLVALSIPAIKRSSPQQYAQFRQVVDALVGADGRVDMFEYCLRTVLFSYLDVTFGLKKPPAIRYRASGAVAQPVAVVLSTLAYIGQKEPAAVERAFQAGAQHVLGQAALMPAEQCALGDFDRALAELAQASPNVKRAVITAVAACITADGQVTVEEGELLRAIAAVLACPMPPIVATL